MKRTVEGHTLTLENAGRRLIIDAKDVGVTVDIRLTGLLTAGMEDGFFDELLALISAGKNVRLNFAKLEHITHTAQKKLIDVQVLYADRVGVRLEICGVTDRMYASFRNSRLDTQLRIRQDV